MLTEPFNLEEALWEIRCEGLEIGIQRGILISEQRGIEIGEQRGIEIGEQKGILIGEQRGIEKGKKEMARLMRADGMAESEVVKYTGYSFKDLDA